MKDLELIVSDEATGISECVETIDGQMAFFGQLIDDMEKHPEAVATFVKYGKIQNQLNAIYYLIDEKLLQIKEYQENIHKILESNSENIKE